MILLEILNKVSCYIVETVENLFCKSYAAYKWFLQKNERN